MLPTIKTLASADILKKPTSFLLLALILYFFRVQPLQAEIVEVHVPVVQKVYIAYYGRPADPAGLDYWTNRLDAVAGNLEEIIESFANSDESRALYDNASDSEKINAIYQQLFGRDSDPVGLVYYEGRLVSGESTHASIMLDILNGAINTDKETADNKLLIATEFSQQLDTTEELALYNTENVAAIRNWLAEVTGNSDTDQVERDIVVILAPDEPDETDDSGDTDSSGETGGSGESNPPIEQNTDNTAPVITVNGENPVSIVQGASYSDGGATATDNIDTTVNVISSGSVDSGTIATYTILYTATDAAGNTSTASRTVNVVAAEATLPRAHRLLVQTTFGPTQEDLERVQLIGVTGWIDEQLAKPSAYDSTADAHQTHLERTIAIAEQAQPGVDWDAGGTKPFNQEAAAFTVDDYQMAAWWENAIGLHPDNSLHGSDQLRQRVAYALSQLLVTSAYEPPLFRRGEALAYYYDILARNALGNYRDLLGEVARSPTMGVYLSHQGNQKADASVGTRPDENFAREIMQLFTVGLYELNRDGSPDRDDDPATYPDSGTGLVPAYTQTDIEELAKVMTGWDLVANTRYGANGNKHGDYTTQMEFTDSEHEDEAEANGDGLVEVLGQSFALNAVDKDGKNSGMDAALDVLFNHPNVGPYVSKHLIMRLVTSNPSTGYIDRVATVFNDDGTGERGNLQAVVRAILVDDEARNDAGMTTNRFGKFKEPLLAWTQLLRATGAVPLDGWTGKENTPVSGVYWFKKPERYLGQGAMRSPSVFNFYSPDYVPSDTAFSGAGMVGPEFQIQTDQILLEYNNKLVTQINTYEKNKITIQDGKTLAEFAATKSFSSEPLMLINFDKELAIIKQALGGDFDAMENVDSDGTALREKAIDELLVHLDQLFLGETMTSDYKAALKEYLLNASGIRNSNNFREALNIVKYAVRMIAASPSYMVQK